MAAPNILCDTAGMTNAQWLAARMHGPSGKIPYTVGGSDVATVFGVSPWTTPLELWMIKKGRMKPPTKSNANQLEMGHLLEPIAAHWYAKKTGNRVYEDTNLYQHADHPYALANFDRRFERASDGEPGILECKSCTYHKASEWDDGAIPLYYELQLRFYLAVADVNIGSFSAIWGNNPDNDLAIPDITRDRAKEDMIFERLDEWIWSLEHDKPPTMSGVAPQLALESLARIYGESQSGLPTIEFSSKQENALRRIALLQGKITECNREIKTYEKEIEAHSVRIAEIMKEHEHGVLTTTSDKLLIDYVTKSTTRPDSKVLKAKYPTMELWNMVQEINKKVSSDATKSFGRYAHLPKRPNPYGSVLRCADCGRVMKYVRSYTRPRKDGVVTDYYNYKCPTNIELGDTACSKKSIRADDLDKIVLSVIRKQMDLFLDTQKTLLGLIALEKEKAKHSVPANRVKELQDKLDQKKKLFSRLYIDFKDGILTQQEYLLARDVYQKEIAAYESELQELQAIKAKTKVTETGARKWNRLISRYHKAETVTEEMVEAMVDEIRVNTDGSLDIRFKYMPEFEEMFKECERIRKEVA